MSSFPRILPLVGIAVGGVLAVNALAGAKGLPDLLSGAKAFAEEVKPTKGKPGDKAEGVEGSEGVPNASVLPQPTVKPAAVCAPTAAELAKEAGLSPAELQVLQSLGERRGELDKREGDLDTQLALMAAAEAKLDAKIRALNGLKGDIQGLLTQADTKQAAEIDRLVKVFEGMKARDAAPRMMVLDDAVRLPIAAKMKERALSAIMAAMPADDSKKLAELLAQRFTNAKNQAMAAEGAAIAQAEKAAMNGTSLPGAAAVAKTPAAAAAAAGAAPAKSAAPKKTAAKAKPKPKAPAAEPDAEAVAG